MTVWGEGLYAKYYFGMRVALRRNSLVYEMLVHIWRLRFTFVFRRTK